MTMSISNHIGYWQVKYFCAQGRKCWEFQTLLTLLLQEQVEVAVKGHSSATELQPDHPICVHTAMHSYVCHMQRHRGIMLIAAAHGNICPMQWQ
jgi:hypothetical protein